MNLAQCRYNPAHKMKRSRLEIHEQKCPDRHKCKIKYVYCPYDPTDLIKEEDLESHKLICKYRPNITDKDQEEIDKAKESNNIETEKEQIKLARSKYYKDCVEEPDIPGLSKASKKNNKKKQNKILKEKFSEETKKEASLFGSMVNREGDLDGEGEETHHLKNFTADQHFDLDFESQEKTNSFGQSNYKNESKNTNDKKIKNDKNKKDSQNNKIINQNKKNYFYKYDPNDEDKDIGKTSANIINPKEIDIILGIEK